MYLCSAKESVNLSFFYEMFFKIIIIRRKDLCTPRHVFLKNNRHSARCKTWSALFQYFFEKTIYVHLFI